MGKQTEKVIRITSAILLLHVLLCAFLIYCNSRIYTGFLGENGIWLVVHWCIYFPVMEISSLHKKLAGGYGDLKLHSAWNIRPPKWVKALLKWSGYVFMGTVIVALVSFGIALLWRGIMSNPFTFGGYMSGIFLLSGLAILLGCFKQEAYIVYSLWILLADALCICAFVIFLIGVRPVSYRQAYRAAAEAGLSNPELQRRGEENNFSAYFGDEYMDMDGSAYQRNDMRISPDDIQEHEGLLGYYFFAGDKNGEPWGMAVSGRTGRVVKQNAIENPFPSP